MTGDLMVDILLVLVVVVLLTAVIHWGRAVRKALPGRGPGPLPTAGTSPGGWTAEVTGVTERPDTLVWATGLRLLPGHGARLVLAAPEEHAEPEEHGRVAVALAGDCGHSGLVGPQVHVTGGNLVTRPAYSMDPLTGCWGINAFPRRTPPGWR